MGRTYKKREEVYAVLRYDAFHEPGTSPDVCITVKEVVRSRELAEAEVERLNAAKGDRACQYWWQPTRLFPPGRSAASAPEG